MWRFLTVILLVGALVPLEASAQRRGSRQESPEREEARRHFEAGVALMNVENWEAALLEFERSLEVFPTRSALFNYGMCQKALFDYVAAMETFQRYLDEYSEEASRSEMRRLNENIEELGRLLGQVLIGVDVPGATIFLDDREIGTAPLSEPVLAVSGRHTVSSRLDGYHPAEQQIAVTSGDQITVALAMREIERVGTLRVEANVPGADVWVDGEKVGVVPFEGTVAEGSHEVRVTAPGYVAQTQTVAIATGEQRIATVSLGESPGTDPLWFWSMVGLTGAAGVTTIALGSMVIVKDDEYRGTTYPSDAQYDEGKNLQLATDICLGITAAAAVAATVLAFTTNWGGDEESPPEGDDDEGGLPPLGATLGPAGDGLGLAIVGRF